VLVPAASQKPQLAGPDPVTRAEELITQLGPYESVVGAKLLDGGYRGYRCVPSSCPVARYLRENGVKARVHGRTYSVRRGFMRWERRVLPYPVRDFVRTFDSGGWRMLRDKL
jgi:hypothetical protein